MKIIYNIINYKQIGGGCLKFKLRLTKDDWILINQLKNKPLSAMCHVEDDLIESSCLDEKIEVIRNSGLTRLIFKFGLDFKEIEEDGKEPYWESPSFEFAVEIGGHPLSDRIAEIKTQLQAKMISMAELVPDEDDSCWGEESSIEY